MAFVVGQVLVVGLLLGPVWSQSWWQGFRRYFANDQLSYAAIASNVSMGEFGLVEPFTMTGSSFYPSLWYQVMGLVALTTGLPVHLLWALMGIAAVCAAVAMVGWVGYRYSGRAYAPVIPALALLTGTFSVRVADYWYTSVASHAALWGPFGTLFTLNGEVAGLSAAAVAVSLLLLATRTESGTPRRRGALVLAAAGIVGLLANVQTYSFFTGSLVTAMFIASWSLLTYRRRGPLIATVAAVAVVLLAGTELATVAGPLPLFALLLLALVPAVVPLVREHARLAMSAAALAVVCAAPQVTRTVLGLAQDDPFLTYRQASTDGLGVPLGSGLLAALPWLLVAAVCAVALWGRRQHALTALVIALGAGVVIMAGNDRWGFDQEPYRFWLQYAVISALLLSVPLAWSLAQIRGSSGARRAWLISTAVIAAAVWGASLADVPAWWRFASEQGIVSAEDDQARALRELLGEHDELVLSSNCLDPRVLKLISPGPVAFYNAGLAWPPDEPAFRTFQDVERRAGEIPGALAFAGVRSVITDSACATDWRFPADQSVVPVRTEDYTLDGQPQQFTLWWVQPS